MLDWLQLAVDKKPHYLAHLLNQTSKLEPLSTNKPTKAFVQLKHPYSSAYACWPKRAQLFMDQPHYHNLFSLYFTSLSYLTHLQVLITHSFFLSLFLCLVSLWYVISTLGCVNNNTQQIYNLWRGFGRKIKFNSDRAKTKKSRTTHQSQIQTQPTQIKNSLGTNRTPMSEWFANTH